MQNTSAAAGVGFSGSLFGQLLRLALVDFGKQLPRFALRVSAFLDLAQGGLCDACLRGGFALGHLAVDAPCGHVAHVFINADGYDFMRLRDVVKFACLYGDGLPDFAFFVYFDFAFCQTVQVFDTDNGKLRAAVFAVDNLDVHALPFCA